MSRIKRYDIHEDYAYSGMVQAGDFVYLTFCVGNVGGTVEEQVDGALDHMAQRLAMLDLTLEDVVQVNVLMRDPWDIPIMEAVFKRRFKGQYPARKTLSTEFAHQGGQDGLKVQIDGVAYKPQL